MRSFIVDQIDLNHKIVAKVQVFVLSVTPVSATFVTFSDVIRRCFPFITLSSDRLINVTIV